MTRLRRLLMVPIRVGAGILVVAIAIAYLLLLNGLLLILWASAAVVGLGILWLLDNFVAEGISNSPLMILGYWVFPFIWLLVGWIYGSILIGIDSVLGFSGKVKPLLHSLGETYSRLIDFWFEAGKATKALEMISAYGKDFPEPSFDQFDLSSEEYFSFNRRFSFSGFIFPLALFSAMAAGYAFAKQVDFKPGIHRGTAIVLAVAVAAAIVAWLAFWFIERLLTRRYPQHAKVEEYEKAREIYDCIQIGLGNHWSKRLLKRSTRR